MQNSWIKILKETFSIENVSFGLDQKEKIFLSLYEWNTECRVYESSTWVYKCLSIHTIYNNKDSWVLEFISSLFAKYKISIFAFTSIHYGYFFFEEKLQKIVEDVIIEDIDNFLN